MYSVTIVTIVLNDVKRIEGTVLSVLSQTYKDKEIIVVDGNSIDGTKDVIHKYKDKVTLFISEPDKGLYDAMNKAISAASGEWIIFINSGDKFYSDRVLEEIFLKGINPETCFIYGSHQAVYPNGLSIVSTPGSLSAIWKGMQFCHQSLFVKLDYIKANMFDIRYKMCADFNLIYSAYAKGVGFLKVDEVVSSVTTEGLSDRNRLNTIMEYWQIAKKYKYSPVVDFYYFGKLFYVFIILQIKRLMPESLVYVMIKLKSRVTRSIREKS